MFDLPAVTVLAAFAAGIISFLSPCVLPLVPGYVSYVAGRDPVGSEPLQGSARFLSPLVTSVPFVLGFSTVFIALGASASMVGQLLLRYRYEANIVGGVIIIVFGLFMTGLLKSIWLSRDIRINPRLKGGRPFPAYVMGLAFAFGWTPCIGPILAAILTMSAAAATASEGIKYLAVYSLGLGVPFMATALFTDWVRARVTVLGRWSRPLHVFAGALLMVMGVAMITGYLTRFGTWLLIQFPWLLNIG